MPNLSGLQRRPCYHSTQERIPLSTIPYFGIPKLSLSSGATVAMNEELAKLGFKDPLNVEGRASIADLFKPTNRCGVYILRFADGTAYVGKANEVTRRYSQHRKLHEDITAISFRRVHSTLLDEVEKETIHRIEAAGVPLRNVTFASYPRGESDLDVLIGRSTQDNWLKGSARATRSGPRAIDDTMRNRYHAKYARFNS
jgi:hypothetical protein